MLGQSKSREASGSDEFDPSEGSLDSAAWESNQTSSVDGDTEIGRSSDQEQNLSSSLYCYDSELAQSILGVLEPHLPAPILGARSSMSSWINQLLESHQRDSTPLLPLVRAQLTEHYPAAVLDETRVITVDRCPTIPFDQLGIEGLELPDGNSAGGITFRNHYFLSSKLADPISTHFHELVHVVQWKILGEQAFLTLYGQGLLRFGYRESPLEIMAYQLQSEFDQGVAAIPVVQRVHDALNMLLEL